MKLHKNGNKPYSGANNYLLHQFFSPHANRRDDQWGGSLAKRMAFPLAVVDAVKQTAIKYADPSFVIGYRFSPEETDSPGFSMADSLELVDALASRELDYIHVSLMDFWPKARSGHGLNRPKIELIMEKAAGRVPVMGVGSIRTAEEARKAIETGIPLLALGRELIVEPDWVKKIEEGNEDNLATTVKNDVAEQERLVILDPMWNVIMNSAPGWIPVV
jgi:2,4-dienoyl-CoA reductase-like NADH-dependent reductase (Old Yellow Enzyme family)